MIKSLLRIYRVWSLSEKINRCQRFLTLPDDYSNLVYHIDFVDNHFHLLELVLLRIQMSYIIKSKVRQRTAIGDRHRLL